MEVHTHPHTERKIDKKRISPEIKDYEKYFSISFARNS